ncbi:MAG: V-type ATP synthase subunit D [Nitrospirota bacterium]|nr:V-type ATP synthase subunit D [Nitrospirota bacterium]
MIHPTRTNLLLLKDKSRSVVNSIGILRARRQALIREFLNTTAPFLRSREEIRTAYGRALDELMLSLGLEGRDTIRSIAVAAERDINLDIVVNSVWGLKYKDIILHDDPVREPDARGYDFLCATPHVEEGIHLFETVLEQMIGLAAFENKLKRLGEEIISITRKIKVLEERVHPELKEQIRTITQHISERERESYYRLKKFKELNM